MVAADDYSLTTSRRFPFKDHDSRSNQLNNSYGRVGLALKESRTAVNIC